MVSETGIRQLCPFGVPKPGVYTDVGPLDTLRQETPFPLASGLLSKALRGVVVGETEALWEVRQPVLRATPPPRHVRRLLGLFIHVHRPGVYTVDKVVSGEISRPSHP